MNQPPAKARLTSRDESITFVLEASDREFPGIKDYWDGNWILVRLMMEIPGLNIDFTDPCIRTDELETFLEDLKGLSIGHSLTAESSFSEPILYINLQIPEPGSDIVLGRIDITLFSDEGAASVAVEMDIDYDAVEMFTQGIEDILREYPVVARETH
ncbi:MAG: hypothetical protein JW984_07500 [Deltaproteobacteria bacterium]|uniref:Uncharacterized protein n=1 Tax=Candidatus Zymogenus saltonus TaxID=2844893 RepID=A0A9D8KEJ1_9DELT|nr:hypothetical protein [Candidatus Zymogenus saltonus]